MPKKNSTKDSDLTRREAVQLAGAATAIAAVAGKVEGFPAIQSVRAASSTVNYAVIGTGGRGQYQLKHLHSVDGGKCVAICDIDETALAAGLKEAPDKPAGVRDYRELLGRKDIDAVLIATPLYTHFPITKDAL